MIGPAGLETASNTVSVHLLKTLDYFTVKLLRLQPRHFLRSVRVVQARVSSNLCCVLNVNHKRHSLGSNSIGILFIMIKYDMELDTKLESKINMSRPIRSFVTKLKSKSLFFVFQGKASGFAETELHKSKSLFFSGELRSIQGQNYGKPKSKLFPWI